MGLLDRLREQRDDDDWRARRGRYAGLEPDTPDRPQVKPVRAPGKDERTHGIGSDGIRIGEGQQEGRWVEPITGSGGVVAKKPSAGDGDGA